MKKFIAFICMMLILTACSQRYDENGISTESIELPAKDKDVQAFVDTFTSDDGVFSFQKSERELYIFVNDTKAATVYEEFSATPVDNVLSIDVKQQPVSEKTEKNASNQRLYKVKKEKTLETDTIQMNMNGEEIPFTSAFVLGFEF